MKNLAVKAKREASTQELIEGRLLSREAGGGFSVRTDRGDLAAKRAVSCLVEPERDDRVLAALLGGGECFILAVLERREGAAATITHDGDLSVRLPRGRYGVVAQKGVSVTSAEDVSIVTGTASVTAVDGTVAVRRLSIVGQLAQAEIEKVKLFAGSFDSLLERASQRVKRSYRVVEEIDQLRAHAVDYAARAVMRLHGKNTVVTSEELVKVDAQQIHMG